MANTLTKFPIDEGEQMQTKARHRLSREERMHLHGRDYVKKFESQVPERLIRLIDHMNIDGSMNVVDFGCGNAMLLSYIHDKVRTYTGVDFSEEFIQAAQKRKEDSEISNATFHCSDIVEFAKGRKGEFDVCFALDLSEHIYDDEWQGIVQSMQLCLKPNGKAYIHTPNADFFIEIMKDKNLILKQFPEHIAVRNLNENVQHFKKAGFRAVKARTLEHYNVLKYLHPLSKLPLIGRYFSARIFIEATK